MEAQDVAVPELVPELVTQRQAAAILATVGLSRRHARRVLEAGLAGRPVQTPAAKLYERDRVESLTSRRQVDPAVDVYGGNDAGPRSVFVARRFVRVDEPRPAQVEMVSGGWDLGLWTPALILLWIRRHGPMPVVVTVGGFVAMGADLVGIGSDPEDGDTPEDGATSEDGDPRENSHNLGDGQSVRGRPALKARRRWPPARLELADPGPWFAGCSGGRLPVGPGNSWRLWGDLSFCARWGR